MHHRKSHRLFFVPHIIEKVEPYWERKGAENKRRKLIKESDNSNAAKVYLEPEDEYTEEILSHLREMDPGKFENFCRGLFTKMGFDVDSQKDIKRSNDFGIDGFGYIQDIRASREGSTPVTLIDGKDLVKLMIRHKYKVTAKPLYILDEEYC